MRKYKYYQLDVFTEKAFAGNPLAVFTDGEDLTGDQMQAIAGEMNLSETVFVLPSDKALRRLRIFTPKQELPLAGHPVVGTWNLLAQLGITPQTENGTVKIEQELNLGVLPVEIEFRAGKPFQVVMTQGKFEAGAIVSNETEINKLADALGLAISDFNFTRDLPIQTVSTGVKSMDVPLSSLDAVKRCRINSQLLSEVYLKYGAIGCYVFTFETIEKDSSIHARFFAPDNGISEDAATGGAAGPLSGYLLHHGAIEAGKFTIEQGDFMHRPSRIFAEVAGEKGKVKEVKIGGSSVIIAEGELFF